MKSLHINYRQTADVRGGVVQVVKTLYVLMACILLLDNGVNRWLNTSRFIACVCIRRLSGHIFRSLHYVHLLGVTERACSRNTDTDLDGCTHARTHTHKHNNKWHQKLNQIIACQTPSVLQIYYGLSQARVRMRALTQKHMPEQQQNKAKWFNNSKTINIKRGTPS